MPGWLAESLMENRCRETENRWFVVQRGGSYYHYYYRVKDMHGGMIKKGNCFCIFSISISLSCFHEVKDLRASVHFEFAYYVRSTFLHPLSFFPLSWSIFLIVKDAKNGE